MKYLTVTGMLLLMGLASNAWGDCSNDGYTNSLNGAQLLNALSGKRILATAPDGEEWNEDHCSTSLNNPGALYKVGDGSAVDPRAFRGTWTPSSGGNPADVDYNYTVGGTSNFTWKVWRNPSTSGLCWEDPGSNATIATAPAPLAIPGGLTCSTPAP